MHYSIGQEELPELLRLALAAARSASELILSGFRSPRLRVEIKADGSPVTDFDREAERTIREFLRLHQPWPVLGEEFGDDSGAARYRWVIDPIDGTLGYSRGLPLFGTLLAFEDVPARCALIGVIHLPAMSETYSAARGMGAWCGGERTHVAPSRNLRDCLVAAPPEHQFRLGAVAASHERLRAEVPHVRSYSDCWAHTMVARGVIDALAEFNLARWDIAATEVIVAEAGGRVRIRCARDVPGKYDLLIGSPGAADAVGALLDF
ncbi:MAG TPA: inositol monophosphatase family protein [Steroidobacteraceae bacterium]